ncbi:hypothetical protein [Staphylococcus caprae]|uniref:hypothetical protein n=1 Tax=Staphylococcus caprae TaxID=29380 RepID=UPI000CD0C0F6|nr:hypothetical protein [Staphylococcus caprae]MBX5322593.1 hypothetical protein [Staphylococcus caprae]POA05586.1 hypothetical protein CD155_04300 [Staphylococcus caprae]SUL95963.1 Uncharacterised protein [Staphylococcus caprae]
MKKSTKMLIALMSGVLIGEVGLYSGGQVKAASEIENNKQEFSTQSMSSNESETDVYIENKKAMKKAIEEIPESEFKNPEAKQQALNSINKSEERGKATMGAKYAAKAIKALMKKMGQKAWDKMIRKIEKSTGRQLVMFHYNSITSLLNFLVHSQDKAQTAISKFLRKQFGFNKYVANGVAKAFVLIVL